MDIDFLLWIEKLRCGFLTAFMSIITNAGYDIAAIGITCLVYWCFNRKTGNRLLLTMLFSLGLNQLLKLAFAAQRPWDKSSKLHTIESAKEDAGGYSFPSGHTSNAAALYLGLSHGKQVKLIWKILAWVLVILVAFSRLYLGVHTPQDVIFGLLLSLVVIFVMDKVCEKLDQNPRFDIAVCTAALAISLAALLLVLFRRFPGSSDTVKANRIDAIKFVSATVGIAVGWLLERRFIKFEKPANLWFALFRVVVGLALVFALLEGTKPPLTTLLGEYAGGAIRYLAACFAAVWLWPLLFTRIETRFAKGK